jgi:hypothetical protein
VHLCQSQFGKSVVQGSGRSIRAFVVTVLAIALSGCRDTAPGYDLLSQGVQSTSVVRSYYESLEQAVLDSWEFEAAFSSLTGVNFGQQEQARYSDRITALAARAVVAHRLEEVYSAALQLRSGSDAQATTAAQELGKALKAVPKLPTAGVDPSDGLGQAADALLGFLRNRSLANSNRVLVSLLQSILKLFSNEAPAYASILGERERSAQHVMAALARQKMVTATPLLHDLATRIGVQWNDAGAPTSQTEALALALGGVREKRAELLDSCATIETEALLSELAGRHQDLAAGRPGNLDDLRQVTVRVSACLQERAEIRKAHND